MRILTKILQSFLRQEEGYFLPSALEPPRLEVSFHHPKSFLYGDKPDFYTTITNTGGDATVITTGIIGSQTMGIGKNLLKSGETIYPGYHNNDGPSITESYIFDNKVHIFISLFAENTAGADEYIRSLRIPVEYQGKISKSSRFIIAS